MAKYLIQWIVVLASLHHLAVSAEVLRDPTMPPNLSVNENDTTQLRAAPVLQSVTLGSTVKFAMINGETVMLGKKYQDYVLVQLKADEAKLRAKDGTSLLLKMDFQVQKNALDVSHKHSGVHHDD
jgi:hypothetical protein